MQEKVTYSCANCSWTKSITAMWQDLRPKKCPTKRCNTNFQKTPEKLLITVDQPEPVQMEAEKPKAKYERRPKQ